MRKLILCILLLVVGLAVRQAQAQTPDVLVLEIEGAVTPPMAAYFERGIEAAEAGDTQAIVIQLNTPGGLVSTSLEIVSLLRNAQVPVIVYVAPNGAQAASAGSIITLAGHANGMAPDTVIGAASPINGDGSDINETAYRKAVEDLKATMRSLTDDRPPEATELAESMIEDARAVTAQEALDVGFIDVIATDMDDLLQQLDGREVDLNGETVTLQTANANLEPFTMSLAERILLVVTNPFIISLLLSLGGLAIYLELANPGGWVAGVVGVVMIGLALYGLGQLPVNWLGFGLVILAFILFGAELFTANNGALSLAGTLCLLGGLLVLFNTPGTPEFARISLPAALTITGTTAALFIFIASKAYGSLRSQPTTGAEGMVGKTGSVRKTFYAAHGDGRYTGTVLVNGEIWQARAAESIHTGEEIVVEQVNGFTLQVRKAHHDVMPDTQGETA